MFCDYVTYVQRHHSAILKTDGFEALVTISIQPVHVKSAAQRYRHALRAHSPALVQIGPLSADLAPASMRVLGDALAGFPPHLADRVAQPVLHSVAGCNVGAKVPVFCDPSHAVKLICFDVHAGQGSAVHRPAIKDGFL